MPWDGTISTVQLEDKQSSISISPNPVTDQMHVGFEDLKSGAIEFISLDGIVFGRSYFKSTSKVNIDVNSLVSGIYYVKVMFDDGEVSVEKVIKL